MARDEPIGKLIGTTLFGSALMGLTMGVIITVNRDGSLSDFGITSAISALYSALIGTSIRVALRVVSPGLPLRTGLERVLIYLGIIVGCSAAGTLATGLVLVMLRVETLAQMWTGYGQGFEIAFGISVPSTIGAFGIGRLRESLRKTEHERERALSLATEARLASLESRVRPHFLFNALNSAIALIPEDPRRAEQLLERLAALLRFSLDVHGGTVALGDELAVVADYLEIERVRFGDRLRYHIDVPDELRALPVPAFAVQTVVENSVKYAVSPRKTGARIEVTARRDGERLVVAVADDGPGFTGQVWIAGHGLDGLRARLGAMYGEAARLVVPAPASVGAAVTMELPAR
jgi:signal transduction histidine kinase